MSLELHRKMYISKRQIVKALEQYALGDCDAIDQVNLRPAVRLELISDEGRSELRRWMNAFAESLSYMKKFDKELSTGAPFNITDWQLMSGSVAQALHMIEIELLELALSRYASQTVS